MDNEFLSIEESLIDYEDQWPWEADEDEIALLAGAVKHDNGWEE